MFNEESNQSLNERVGVADAKSINRTADFELSVYFSSCAGRKIESVQTWTDNDKENVTT